MSKNDVKVCIVGAGIAGMSVAVKITEELFNRENGLRHLTIIAERFTPDTTTDVAVGLWEPFHFGEEEDKEAMMRWCTQTMKYLEKRSLEEDAPLSGIYPQEAILVSNIQDLAKDFFWKELYTSYEELTQDQIRKFFPKKYKSGVKVGTFMAEGTKILTYYTELVKSRGCELIQKKVNSLNEVANDYDIVINCTGLNSKHLCRDENVTPIRGQMVKIKAPWIRYAYIDDNSSCLPLMDYVAVGTVRDRGDWNPEPTEADNERILRVGHKFLPSIKLPGYRDLQDNVEELKITLPFTR